MLVRALLVFPQTYLNGLCFKGGMPIPWQGQLCMSSAIVPMVFWGDGKSNPQQKQCLESRRWLLDVEKPQANEELRDPN